MARWTGTWLSGPEHTLSELRNPDSWPGARLGLPREGTGSVAPFSARAAALVIDAMGAGLLAAIFFPPNPDRTLWQGSWPGLLVLVLEHVLLVALMGKTVGMRFLGIRVVRLVDPDVRPGLGSSLVRTLVLLLTAWLAGFFTKDGRGLHDVAARTAVVRV